MQGKVLIVDDDRSMCDLLEAGLSKSGLEITTRTSAQEAMDLLSQMEFDAVVTDLNMGEINGLELCANISESQPDVPVIVITAFGSLDSAVAAIRAGAYDFVTKPFDPEQLILILDRGIQYRRLNAEVKRLRREVADARRFHGLIGESPPMKRLYDLIGRVADSESSVLITGETGTGKELVARALHQESRRHDHPFVPVNCAALPEQLLESELFGHVKGAFTDARAGRKGLFAEADQGTLFLDEIATLPLSLQAKLLRALQERTIRPVGGDKELSVDVRIVAATNRDLEAGVEAGTFREDLLFRINVIPIDLPPLRTRGNDILLLAQHFLQYFSARARKQVVGICSAAAEKLASYSWPGNVRELQNSIEHGVALTRYDQLTVDDLPQRIREHVPSKGIVLGEDLSQLLPMEEVERRYILRVVEAVGGNKTLAAQTLGMDRKTLYRKLESYLPGQKPG
jgi:two-component system, NtrC family, response regulator AtoC